ncbi:MAG: hypothetical protein LBS06_07580 [Treponema sp.]|jgi:hypothetical protein|nr:hypothetical protein [Treponema sp.]
MTGFSFSGPAPKKGRGGFFFFVLLPLLAAACSKSAPEIDFGFMELVYYQSPGRAEERFSFFIIPRDDDGIENLSELFLYHDGAELRWRLAPEDWVSYEEDGKTWIGSRAIAMDGEALPRGQYRAVLVNKGGERAERLFSFDAPEESPYPFPYLSVADGRYRIDSFYPENKLLCYDGEGGYLKTQVLDRPEGPLADLQLPAAARSAALWAADPLLSISALTDVASLR